MKALILAGGYATRLYPLTKDTPKPLLKLKNKAIIDYIVDQVDKVGDVDKVFVVSNNKFYDQFEDWVIPKSKEFPGRYKIINDGSNNVEDRLGAIGDLNLTINSGLIDDDLLVVAGDNLFDFNLNDFVHFGYSKRPYHSVCLYLPTSKEINLTQYGIAHMNSESQVTHFEEKPQQPKSNLISTCIYFIPKEKLHFVNDYLQKGHYHDTPGSYISWLAQHDKVYGRIFDGMWYDLGDFDSISKAIVHLNNHNHSVKV